jgi:O-antigen/teichoic acid export membrane protein
VTRPSRAVERTSALPAPISSLLSRVRESKLAQDAVKLLFLQLASRLVAFFGAAQAIRSLGPDQLGTGAFAIAVVTQFAVLGDLGLNVAGIRSMHDEPGTQTETISTVLGLRLSVSVLFAVLLLAWALAFRTTGSMLLWLLAAPLIFMMVLNAQWIYQGIERVPVYNTLQLVQTLTAAALYFALFRSGATAELYVVVALASQAVSWALSYYFLRGRVRFDLSLFRWRRGWEMLRKSSFAFAAVLTTFVYTGLDIPLVTLLVSTHEAGVYRAAQTIVGALAPLIAMVPLLVYPRLLVWKSEGIPTFVRNGATVMVTLAALGLAIAASSLLWVPIAVSKLYGADYLGSIVPCIVLVAGRCIALVGTVPAWGLYALNLDRRFLVVTVVAAVASITSNLLLIGRFGIVAAAGTAVLSEVIILAGMSAALVAYLRSRRAAEAGPEQRPADGADDVGGREP